MQASLERTLPEISVTGFLKKTHQLFIGGRWVPAESGETFEVLDPATGKVLATLLPGVLPTSTRPSLPLARPSNPARGRRCGRPNAPCSSIVWPMPSRPA
jgi:hypothetical protein